MRDPNRIDTFLKELGDYWKSVPDWRFGQLIDNIVKTQDRDIFFLEENEFLEITRKLFKYVNSNV